MERSTRQRRAVLDALAGSGLTLNPPAILEMARQDAPGLNLSTVYRQIKALEADGEIVKVELPGQPARFEVRCGQANHLPAARPAAHANGQPHHHHHFHCTACEVVVAIHACPGNMQSLAPRGYQVEAHDLILHGKCPACADRASA